jgi:hypothetical protein
MSLKENVERLEKVQDSLAKKQTDKLRAERDELMVEIQQEVQAHREANDSDWRYAHNHLLTHEQIEVGKPSHPTPRSVKGDVN